MAIPKTGAGADLMHMQLPEWHSLAGLLTAFVKQSVAGMDVDQTQLVPCRRTLDVNYLKDANFLCHVYLLSANRNITAYYAGG
jgi:hypothetical protein